QHPHLGVDLVVVEAVASPQRVESGEQATDDRNHRVDVMHDLVEDELQREGGEDVGADLDEGERDGEADDDPRAAEVAEEEAPHGYAALEVAPKRIPLPRRSISLPPPDPVSPVNGTSIRALRVSNRSSVTRTKPPITTSHMAVRHLRVTTQGNARTFVVQGEWEHGASTAHARPLCVSVQGRLTRAQPDALLPS